MLSKMHYVDVSDEEAAERQKIYAETFLEYFQTVHSSIIVNYNPFSEVLGVIDEREEKAE